MDITIVSNVVTGRHLLAVLNITLHRHRCAAKIETATFRDRQLVKCPLLHASDIERSALDFKTALDIQCAFERQRAAAAFRERADT